MVFGFKVTQISPQLSTFPHKYFFRVLFFCFCGEKVGGVLRRQKFGFENTEVKETGVKPYVLRSQKLRRQELSRMFCGLGICGGGHYDL